MHGDPNTDASSETTGPSFDPSGTRLYFSSQRAFGFGVVYEVTGPFRSLPKPSSPSPSPAPPPAKFKLATHAYRRTLKSRLAKQGFRVGLSLNQPADVTSVLRAPVGAQGSMVTLAVGIRRSVLPGDTKLSLALTRKGKGYLKRRGKPVGATIVTTATTTTGEREVVERPIALR
jgi:hypothetical protein